jgi:hypothetical protein
MKKLCPAVSLIAFFDVKVQGQDFFALSLREK